MSQIIIKITLISLFSVKKQKKTSLKTSLLNIKNKFIYTKIISVKIISYFLLAKIKNIIIIFFKKI